MKLTQLEKEMIKDIKEDYEKNNGCESNTEFHNLYGFKSENNKELRKKLRGAFASLKRKKIVDCGNDPRFFNPIFRGENWEEAINSL